MKSEKLIYNFEVVSILNIGIHQFLKENNTEILMEISIEDISKYEAFVMGMIAIYDHLLSKID